MELFEEPKSMFVVILPSSKLIQKFSFLRYKTLFSRLRRARARFGSRSDRGQSRVRPRSDPRPSGVRPQSEWGTTMVMGRVTKCDEQRES
jgi:hypothetical protein